MSNRMIRLLKKAIPFFILLVVISGGIFNFHRMIKGEASRLKLYEEQQLEHIANKVESSYFQLKISLEYMNVINPPTHKADEIKWINQARYIMDTFEGITNISYVSNDFVVGYTVAAQNSLINVGERATQKVLDDSFIEIWNPVYLDGKVNGFVLTYIDLVKFLEPQLSLVSKDYDVAIIKGTKRIFNTNSENQNEQVDLVSKLIVLENNGTYRITIATGSKYLYETAINHALFIAFSVILTIVISLLFFILRKSYAKSHQLEKISADLIEKQEELYTMVDLANSASEAKGQFLANMSHEIRTPISAIIGMNYLLSQTELNDKQADYNSKIDTASKNLLAIVNNILDFSKIEAGKVELNISEFAIMDVMGSVVDMLFLRAENKGLQFTVNVAKDIPSKIYGDSMRLQQVLINLLANAIKFTKQGQVVFEAMVKKYSHDNKILLRFVVSDTGIGMTSDEQAKLFDEFEQAQKSIVKEYGGTGLGLSISKKLVELMDGNIEVSSKKGEGSTFYVDIPFAYESDQNSINEEIDSKENKDTYKNANIKIEKDTANNNKKILVVEDNAMNQQILYEILKARGYIVDVANDGVEAVKIVTNQKVSTYDLIIMDLHMPKMSGYEATQLIYENNLYKRIPIIALTAEVLKDTERKVFQSGMKGYLTKPIILAELYKMLDNIFMNDYNVEE